MSKEFDELMTSLNQAIAIEKGQLKGRKTVYVIEPVKSYTNVQIKQIRNSVGMTQLVFANFMGVSCKTVEAWERGTNRPAKTACRLLSILEDNSFNKLSFVSKTR